MRQIDFSDGYETSAAPDQGVLQTGGFGAYSSDAAFETALLAAGGTLAAGNAYFNTVENRIHFYDGTNWVLSTARIDSVFFLPQYASNAAFETALSDSGGTLVEGAQYWNTASNLARVYDGSAWHDVLQADLQQTITNKDYDGGNASATRRLTLPKGTFSQVNALPRKAGNLYFVTDGGGTIYFDNGTSLIAGLGTTVDSVNGQIGVVILTTSDIAEGSNLYFTDARAKSAAVQDAIVDAVTDIAPSQNAVFDALALKRDVADTTDAITEGVTNLYFTDARAKAAAVEDAINDGVVDKAPSENAVFDALALKRNASDTTDAITEGATNLYFTDARARTAAVENAINNGVTNKAPSEDAVFDALSLKEDLANKGAPDGYPELDPSGKIPISQLPDAVLGAARYQGTWDANTNTPDVGSTSPLAGYFYIVSVAGSTTLDGITPWAVGDWAIYNGTNWEKIPASALVVSVNGQTGTVVLDTDDVAEGATNLYYTDARAKAATVADAIADAVTDVAPSQNAVFDALALKLDKSEQHLKKYVKAASNVDVPLTGAIPITVDGVSMVNDDRVLLFGQTNPIQNGIYFYEDDGVNYTFTRALDADGSGDLWPGTHVYSAIGGTDNADTLFYCNNTAPFTIDVDSISFDRATNIVRQTITNGVTKYAPSEDAVFDALALKQDLSEKSQPNGYASLDAGGLVPAAELPIEDAINDGVVDKVPTENAVFDALATKLNTTDTTDVITEGVTNLYFTDARARTAVVEDAINDGTVDKAPSENAVFDALALKEDVLPISSAGDLLYENSGRQALAIGEAGQRMKVSNSLLPSWEDELMPTREMKYLDDFMGGNLGSELAWQSVVVGSAAANSNDSTYIDNNHPGVIKFSTGSTASGRAGLVMATPSATMQNGFVSGSGKGKQEFMLLLPTLSVLAEEYIVTLGSIRHASADVQANAIMFQFDRLNSGDNWQCVTASGGSVTTTDSGVAVVAGTWIRLTITMVSGEVKFYIDGVLVATHSTNIPSVNIVPALKIQKTNGTTAREMHADYFAHYIRFGTPR
jgi:hypothetical protein